MKHHDRCRPVGKCKGCCLNLKFICAAGFRPKERWDRKRCTQYNDEELLQKLLTTPPPEGAKLARLHRRAKAARMATNPHYNGVLDPGKMAGRTRRRPRRVAV